jgi:hypothetical protein
VILNKIPAGYLAGKSIRYNLAYKKAHGESRDADIEGVEERIKMYTLKGWDPSDVYNCDGTALFYISLPEGSYIAKKRVLEAWISSTYI